MIILFSIFLLLVLVYIGIRMKEGMTTSVGGQLIDILNTYYKATEKNKTEGIDNSKNESNTLTSIQNLNITDAAYVTILNSDELNDSSKINMINKTISESLNQKKTIKYMDLNTYKGIIRILQDTEMITKPSQQVNEIKNIVYINQITPDPRFVYIFDGTKTYKDDAERVIDIQEAAYNALNSF